MKTREKRFIDAASHAVDQLDILRRNITSAPWLDMLIQVRTELGNALKEFCETGGGGNLADPELEYHRLRDLADTESTADYYDDPTDEKMREEGMEDLPNYDHRTTSN